jgi:hypothetical protein
MKSKYPTQNAIKEHKDQLWSTLLQYYIGAVPFYNVENSIRKLMGDAALYVHNNHKKLDMKKITEELYNLTIPRIRMVVKRSPPKTFVVYFQSTLQLKNFKDFMETATSNAQKLVLEKTITGKEFTDKAYEKAKEWGRGKEPTLSIFHTHLYNMLHEPNVKVFIEET